MCAEEKLKRTRREMPMEGYGVCRERTYVSVFHPRTKSVKLASGEKGNGDGGAKDASGPSVSCGAGRGR